MCDTHYIYLIYKFLDIYDFYFFRSENIIRNNIITYGIMISVRFHSLILILNKSF